MDSDQFVYLLHFYRGVVIGPTFQFDVPFVKFGTISYGTIFMHQFIVHVIIQYSACACTVYIRLPY